MLGPTGLNSCFTFSVHLFRGVDWHPSAPIVPVDSSSFLHYHYNGTFRELLFDREDSFIDNNFTDVNKRLCGQYNLQNVLNH